MIIFIEFDQHEEAKIQMFVQWVWAKANIIRLSRFFKWESKGGYFPSLMRRKTTTKNNNGQGNDLVVVSVTVLLTLSFPTMTGTNKHDPQDT